MPPAALFLMALALACLLWRLTATAGALTEPSAVGRELADLLESETSDSLSASCAAAATSSNCHAHQHLSRAFDASTARRIATQALRRQQDNDEEGQANAEVTLQDALARGDGVLDRERTVVRRGRGGSTDVCFAFHTRHFFHRANTRATAAASVASGANAARRATQHSPTSLQLWPYFYQNRGFLEATSNETQTHTLRGVLDVDAAAFSLLREEAERHREVELLLLAYNDWDAHADAALAALENFARAHHCALYRDGNGLSGVSAETARQCAHTRDVHQGEFVAVRRDAFQRIITSAPADVTDSCSAAHAFRTASYATVQLPQRTAGGAGRTVTAAPPLQLIGATRMSAFRTRRSVFADFHRSRGPTLYFFNSENLCTLRRATAATTGAPPSLPLRPGFSSRDVQRFVHQHTRTSFLLGDKAAYQRALQLHPRLLVLTGYAPLLRHEWWASLSGPPRPSTELLRRLRRHIPFFLSVSRGPIAAVEPSPRSTGSAAVSPHRCVLPTIRLDMGREVELVYEASYARTQLRSLVWREELLQLRVVQPRRAAGACQWVQQIQLPHPTNATDVLFYDRAVMGSVVDFVQRQVAGEGNVNEGGGWVPYVQSHEEFARQLDRLFQPAVGFPGGRARNALVVSMASSSSASSSSAETSRDCTAALQRLQGRVMHERLERSETGVAFATLAARLTTLREELDLASEKLSFTSAISVPHVSPLSALFTNASKATMDAWEHLVGTCPPYVVMRDTERIYRLVPSSSLGGTMARRLSSASEATSTSLEVVEDEAVALALVDVHRTLTSSAYAATEPADGNAAASTPEVRSDFFYTPIRHHRWWLVLPSEMEVPVLVYEAPEAARHPPPVDGPTVVLLMDRACGVCSNYMKAVELLRRTYTRNASAAKASAAHTGSRNVRGEGADAPDGDRDETARFVQVDVSRGFTESRRAATPSSDRPTADRRIHTHWQRAQDVLFPYYLTDLARLKIPQLLLLNGTHVVTTLSTEAYAERWHWPHAVLRLLALVDTATDVEATKKAMWSVVQAETVRRRVFRGDSTARR